MVTLRLPGCSVPLGMNVCQPSLSSPLSLPQLSHLVLSGVLVGARRSANSSASRLVPCPQSGQLWHQLQRRHCLAVMAEVMPYSSR